MTNDDIPTEYADWTLSDIHRVYAHRPHECPEALRGWLDAAILARETEELRRRNDALEARLRARRAN